MNKQLATWQFISKHLQQSIAVMLLYVLQSNGSSPGRQGFFMAVTADGQMQGSIGGGIMEHKFVELAKTNLLNVDHPSTNIHASIKKQVHNKEATKNQSGMICSGEQTILMYEIKKADLFTIESIITCLQVNNNGQLQLSPSGISFSNEEPSADFYFENIHENNWLYKEKIGFKNKLYIIGAGHCSLAFAALMHQLDFYIYLYDDRENLNTFYENNFVHEKFIVDDYSQLQELIPVGKNHYVVIMTFGYRTDSIALKALLNKDFKYIGMLGSKRKVEQLFENYKDENINEHLFKQIHSPIGIAIKSKTPEEIAISIAAEIIQVKNEFLP